MRVADIVEQIRNMEAWLIGYRQLAIVDGDHLTHLMNFKAVAPYVEVRCFIANSVILSKNVP